MSSSTKDNIIAYTIGVGGSAIMACFIPLWVWMLHDLAGINPYAAMWGVSFLYCLSGFHKALNQSDSNK